MPEKPKHSPETPPKSPVAARRKKIEKTLAPDKAHETRQGMEQQWLAASKIGDLQTLQQLLDKGVDINAHSQQGQTALMLAASERLAPVAEFLIQRGAEVNLRNDYGLTALMVASMNDSTEIVELLGNHGAAMDIRDAREGQTALILAARFKASLGTFQALLRKEKSLVNFPRNDQSTALTFETRPEIAEFLINNGAEVDHPNSQGRTPLIESAYNRKPELLKVYIDQGANINAQDKDGRTALNRAAANGQLENVRLLLESGADPTIADLKNRTALAFAQINKHEAVVALLLQTMKEKGIQV
jgi:uncharacterized protein